MMRAKPSIAFGGPRLVGLVRAAALAFPSWRASSPRTVARSRWHRIQSAALKSAWCCLRNMEHDRFSPDLVTAGTRSMFKELPGRAATLTMLTDRSTPHEGAHDETRITLDREAHAPQRCALCPPAHPAIQRGRSARCPPSPFEARRVETISRKSHGFEIPCHRLIRCSRSRFDYRPS